jgi:putative transposase
VAGVLSSQRSILGFGYSALLRQVKSSHLYTVKKLDLPHCEQLDNLARAAGELYTRILVSYWRVVRKKNIFLSQYGMEKWHISPHLHAHSSDAIAGNFYAAIKSAQERKKSGDKEAKYPKRRKWFYKITWKSSAIRIKNGKLILSNGKGNQPLEIQWQWDKPKQVEIGWKKSGGYQLRATYPIEPESQVIGDKVASVDLGDLRSATVYDGENTFIYSGRLLRSLVRYRNKITGKLQELISRTKKGSNRRKRLFRTKEKQLALIERKINDILHKQTTHIVSTLQHTGVQTLVIGDIRDIRKAIDYGAKANQKLHSWSFGKFRFMLTYKAQRAGMKVALQDERHTSKTCPRCGNRHKPSGRLYKCKKCDFAFDRDGVGAINIRRKYLGCFDIPVVGDMATPIGVRYRPHLQCSFRLRSEAVRIPCL